MFLFDSPSTKYEKSKFDHAYSFRQNILVLSLNLRKKSIVSSLPVSGSPQTESKLPVNKHEFNQLIVI